LRNALTNSKLKIPRRWRRGIFALIFACIATGLTVGASLLISGSVPPGAVPPMTAVPVPTPTSWPLPERTASPEVGINVHMWWDPWAALRRDWHLVQDAGFVWVKQRLAWADVEGAGPGHYDWQSADFIVDEAGNAGVSLLLRVDHPPVWAVTPDTEAAASFLPISLEAFGDFCSVVAQRYRGRVRAYQIWNEPNLAREWEGHVPDPAGYVRVLQTCYVAIKQADPDALVVSAGLAPTGSSSPEAMPDEAYLVGMYEAGAAPYFDMLGLNAPGYKAPPEIAPEEVANPESGYGGHGFFCFRHAEGMRAIMERYGDAHKQVAILEFGWHTNDSPEHPDYSWFAVTPEEQGAYLVRALQYAEEHWSPWVGPMFVWNLPDPKWTPEHEEFWWGIADPFWWGIAEGDDVAEWSGGALRPAYHSLMEWLQP
jgi:polysaccharide biosynthesis protein PslG